MSSSNKRLKETQIDRLSELPDSLIIHILSFLEVKQSAVTTVLAKRYQNLWRKSPRLVFKENRLSWNVMRDFVARVNRTLLLISGVNQNGLEAFEIQFIYNIMYRSDVDVWFDFAIRNKAKQITVLLNYTQRDHLYSLPQMMFHNSNLKRLRLGGCVVAPWRNFEWQSLAELSIGWVELPEHVIGNILSGCPLLYFLSIIYCWGFNRLEVESRSLRSLSVIDQEHETSLHISAPYIYILEVSVYCNGRKLCLCDTSSLVEATIGCFGYNLHNAKELLEKIGNVGVVRMGSSYNQVLSSLAMTGYRFPQSARTHLSIIARTVKHSIHGIIGQLESCPILKTLVIEGLYLEGEHIVCPDPKGDLNWDLPFLKTITLKNFVDPNLAGEPMLTLARIVLNKASALETMKIEGIGELTLATEIAKTLLSYPRSSVKAVILIN